MLWSPKKLTSPTETRGQLIQKFQLTSIPPFQAWLFLPFHSPFRTILSHNICRPSSGASSQASYSVVCCGTNTTFFSHQAAPPPPPSTMPLAGLRHSPPHPLPQAQIQEALCMAIAFSSVDDNGNSEETRQRTQKWYDIYRLPDYILLFISPILKTQITILQCKSCLPDNRIFSFFSFYKNHYIFLFVRSNTTTPPPARPPSSDCLTSLAPFSSRPSGPTKFVP